jgi:ABC exporter DevB family membrane fusion protein
MRGFLFLILGIAVGAGSPFLWQYWSSGKESSESSEETRHFTGEPAPSRDSRTNRGLVSTSGARRAVRALGTIEPRDGIVAVSSPLIGFQIREVVVREGDQVAAGDLLLRLDAVQLETELDLALLQLTEAEQRQQGELRLASQRLRAAELAYEQALTGGDLEREAQQSRLSAVEIRHEQAQRDLARLIELRQVRESLASEQQVEQQRVLADSAAAELRGAELSLRGLEQSLEFQRKTAEAELEGARTAHELAGKTTGLDTLKRQVELARFRLAQAEVRAPSAGTILSLTARPGELISQQPLCQMADLGALICIAEIDATDVPLLQDRHAARVHVPGYPRGGMDGELQRIGSSVVESRLRPLDPRRPIDRHVARGIVNLSLQDSAGSGDSASSRNSAAWIGLQVEVDFPLSVDSPATSDP